MTAHLPPTTLFRIAGRRPLRLQRRTVRAAVMLLLTASLAALVGLQTAQLQRTSLTTGCALFATVLFLISLHWRKQAPSLPLGKISVWLQYHLYAGYLVIGLFALHVGFRLPGGLFESGLFLVFVIVAGSGVYGLYITRTIPQQLRLLPQEVVYEKIPALRREVAAQSRQLLRQATSESSVLVRFYRSHLALFLEQPRELSYWLRPSSRQRRALLDQLREMQRFLNPQQRAMAEQLAQLVCRKDDLDFHAALQGRLKLWMYVHIAFSYSLLLLGTLHGILALAFYGGAR